MKFLTTMITSWESEAINEEKCPKYTWKHLLYIVNALRSYHLLSIEFRVNLAYRSLAKFCF